MFSICCAVKNNGYLSHLVGFHISTTELMDNIVSLEADGRRTDNGKVGKILTHLRVAWTSATSRNNNRMSSGIEKLVSWYGGESKGRDRSTVRCSLISSHTSAALSLLSAPSKTPSGSSRSSSLASSCLSLIVRMVIPHLQCNKSGLLYTTLY